MRTAFERTHDQLRISVHRQNQYFTGMPAGTQLGQCVQAAGGAHGDIQQDDVRLQLCDKRVELAAVIRFTNHRIASDVRHERAHTRANERMVIDQK